MQSCLSSHIAPFYGLLSPRPTLRLWFRQRSYWDHSWLYAGGILNVRRGIAFALGNVSGGCWPVYLNDLRGSGLRVGSHSIRSPAPLTPIWRLDGYFAVAVD